MAHPEFTVLLARQRSGTNALRSVLGTHPDIHCFDETFNLAYRTSPDPLKRAGNYFSFLEKYCAGDVTRAFPDRHEQVFADYLAHLAGETPKRLKLIDVKYNSTHFLEAPFRSLADPTLFPLVRRSGVAVLHLTRRNLLRCFLSHLKAWSSDRYFSPEGVATVPDVTVSVPIEPLVYQLERWAAEDEQVAWAFVDYEHYKRLEYTDVFPDAAGSIGRRALAELAAWFGVPNRFENRATLRKQSSLPLDRTIQNIDAVAAALRGTRFEACLGDEPAYRTPPHTQPAA